MEGIGEDLAGRRLLDQPAGVHDAEAVGHVGVDRHVVRDEQDRGADLLLHLADHREHALLHHDVEGGGRLIGDMNSGRHIVASAMVTRWRMPPDNSCG